jgi:hypothetical protein
MCKHPWLRALALAWPLLLPPLHAAESEQNTSEQEQNEPALQTQNSEEDPLLVEAAEAENTQQRPPAASDDTFTPSVQISEDLSVSFPVDI